MDDLQTVISTFESYETSDPLLKAFDVGVSNISRLFSLQWTMLDAHYPQKSEKENQKRYNICFSDAGRTKARQQFKNFRQICKNVNWCIYSLPYFNWLQKWLWPSNLISSIDSCHTYIPEPSDLNNTGFCGDADSTRLQDVSSARLFIFWRA